MSEIILSILNQYYTEKLRQFGNTPQGVDWNGIKSQELRFDKLLNIVNQWDKPFSINDFGCGYGYLYEYIVKKYNLKIEYFGTDISEKMIEEAKKLYPYEHCHFIQSNQCEKIADYTVSSGIFNLKLDFAKDMWLDYILQNLKYLNNSCKKGFAFNCLTKYSDKEYMRPNLYYADPCFLFDYCKTKFSKNVALLHDYGLYEFTILVKKEI